MNLILKMMFNEGKNELSSIYFRISLIYQIKSQLMDLGITDPNLKNIR